jgi:hypothetical protein
MRSPFPGVDPYIEDRGLWRGFHTSLLVRIQTALNESLPEAYISTIEEDIHVARADGDFVRLVRPDALVGRDPEAHSGYNRGSSSLAIAEPITVPWLDDELQEVYERYLVIVKLPDLHPVTFIELLSPTNKYGSGRSEYLEKRRELYRGPAHLVEIDLLLRGRPLPLGKQLPHADFFASISRVEKRPDTDVYAWTLRQPLPTIAIPLETPDPDVPLDLAAAFATAYERGRYGQILRYEQPLDAPLSAENRDCVEAIVVAAR